MSAGGGKEYFPALDALRGLAALFVAQRHAEVFFGAPIGSTYLALDLFFCISGFVMANAYEARLRDGSLSFGRFVWLRLIRFWPLLLLADVAMAAGVLFAGSDRSHLLANAIFTAFLLPTPQRISGVEPLFPLVFVAWSLFWEFLCSIAYGLVARRLSNSRLLRLTALAGGTLVVSAMTFGTLNAGFLWSSFWAGGAGRIRGSLWGSDLSAPTRRASLDPCDLALPDPRQWPAACRSRSTSRL